MRSRPADPQIRKRFCWGRERRAPGGSASLFVEEKRQHYHRKDDRSKGDCHSLQHPAGWVGSPRVKTSRFGLHALVVSVVRFDVAHGWPPAADGLVRLYFLLSRRGCGTWGWLISDATGAVAEQLLGQLPAEVYQLPHGILKVHVPQPHGVIHLSPLGGHQDRLSQ